MNSKFEEEYEMIWPFQTELKNPIKKVDSLIS